MELKILNFEIDVRAVYSRDAEKFDRGVNIHFHSVFIIICFAINHNKKTLTRYNIQIYVGWIESSLEKISSVNHCSECKADAKSTRSR